MSSRKNSEIGRIDGLGRPLIRGNPSDILEVPINDDIGNTPQEDTNLGHHQDAVNGGSGSQEQHGLGETHVTRRSQRTAWSQQEYRELMWCYEYGKLSGKGTTKEIYEIWRARNQTARPNIDANKLANQRRYIAQNNKLSPQLMEEIKAEVQLFLTTEAQGMHERFEEQTDENGKDTSSNSPLRNNATGLKNEILVKLYEVTLTPVHKRPYLQKVPKLASATMIREANNVLMEILQEQIFDITGINHLIYSTASVITSKFAKEKLGGTEKQWNKNNALRRLEVTVERIRCELSLLIEYKKGNIRKKRAKMRYLLKRLGISSNEALDIEIEKHKQLLAAKVQRKRRFKKRVEQFKQNKLFQVNQKKFYRNLRGEKFEVNRLPPAEKIEEFWSGIYENEIRYNKRCPWIQQIEEEVVAQMNWPEISKIEVKQALRKTLNWKSPGLDKIANFWLKQLTSVHDKLTSELNRIVRKELRPPDWLTEGVTTLVPKKAEVAEPKDFRPITCLPTIYKVLTSIFANRLAAFLKEQDLVPVEQKGCCKGAWGCKDQLLVSKAILEDCKQTKGNLAQAWIDYQKAFDSVPHDWVIKVMELYGVAPDMVETYKQLMSSWKTTCFIRTGNTKLKTRTLQIKRGIFQGDSLSPLLFCLSLFPMSKMINDLKYGYKLQQSNSRISHLIYMDDLKLICKSRTELEKQILMVRDFSKNIRMQFGIDKCALLIIRAGQMMSASSMVVEEGAIRQLESGMFYRYLGVDEASMINHEEMKKKLLTEYRTRLRAILRTELNGRNKISAIEALAVPVLQYSFGIVNWTIDEIRKVDTKTRKMLTMYSGLHPMACVERLYIPRSQGGRGLLQIERAYKSAIINLSNYIKRRSEVDKVVKMVKEYDEKCSRLGSISKKSEKFICELRIAGELNNSDDTHKVKQQVKQAFNRQAMENWKNKNMYGQYIRDIESQPLYKDGTFRWLKTSGLKIETESLIVAAQDQALRTRYKEKKIYKMPVDSRCRICKTAEETITHILSSCSILAQRDYIQRHDKVAILIHYNICKELDIKVTKNWYEHVPKPVQEKTDGSATILWNIPVNTDRLIPANKPDIVVKFNGRERKCLIIDISVPADANVIKKETEKILKYADLKIEIQRMWASKTEIVPIVIGATGAISTKLQSYLTFLPGKHSADLLQKTALLGTSTILRRTIT